VHQPHFQPEYQPPFSACAPHQPHFSLHTSSQIFSLFTSHLFHNAAATFLGCTSRIFSLCTSHIFSWLLVTHTPFPATSVCYTHPPSLLFVWLLPCACALLPSLFHFALTCFKHPHTHTPTRPHQHPNTHSPFPVTSSRCWSSHSLFASRTYINSSSSFCLCWTFQIAARTAHCVSPSLLLNFDLIFVSSLRNTVVYCTYQLLDPRNRSWCLVLYALEYPDSSTALPSRHDCGAHPSSGLQSATVAACEIRSCVQG
jgi:hypothetical protein